MAIVLQEVVGNRYNDRFYPTISGVARSLNFYPIGNEKAEDGIANIALGLGKYIVDGGQTLRFSPRHPHNILQMSTMDFALRETQTRFYALDLKNLADQFSVDDSFNLLRLNLKDADADGSLKFIVSTYDPYDQVIRDGYYPGGRKILSFVNVLQHEVFPLADTLDQILHVGQDEMGRPIEIEFAVNIDPQNPGFATFYLLQVRPIVDNKEVMEEDLTLVEQEDTILTSTSVLGHGIVTDVQDIIYVKTGAFCSSNNQSIAYDMRPFHRNAQPGVTTSPTTRTNQNIILFFSCELAVHLLDIIGYRLVVGGTESTGEMASYQQCTCYSGMWAGELSCRSEPGNAFFPKSDFVWCRLLYDQPV